MNPDIIFDRLKETGDNLVILEKLAELDEAAFISDPEKYKLAERCFQLAIESMLDQPELRGPLINKNSFHFVIYLPLGEGLKNVPVSAQ